MPIEIFFTLIIGGPLLILLGLMSLIYRLYQINTVQGAVTDVSPELGLFFGLLNWKHTKIPMLMMFVGALMVGSLFWVDLGVRPAYLY